MLEEAMQQFAAATRAMFLPIETPAASLQALPAPPS
jgi:hypothetical protein